MDTKKYIGPIALDALLDLLKAEFDIKLPNIDPTITPNAHFNTNVYLYRDSTNPLSSINIYSRQSGHGSYSDIPIIHVDNTGIKFNGHTLLSDVPADAKFTDTTYDLATTTSSGLMSASDKIAVNSIASKVTGPTSSVTNRVATFSDTTGKAIKDSGYTIATSVPANAKFTDTTYKLATVSNDGLLSANDYYYLNRLRYILSEADFSDDIGGAAEAPLAGLSLYGNIQYSTITPTPSKQAVLRAVSDGKYMSYVYDDEGDISQSRTYTGLKLYNIPNTNYRDYISIYPENPVGRFVKQITYINSLSFEDVYDETTSSGYPMFYAYLGDTINVSMRGFCTCVSNFASNYLTMGANSFAFKNDSDLGPIILVTLDKTTTLSTAQRTVPNFEVLYVKSTPESGELSPDTVKEMLTTLGTYSYESWGADCSHSAVGCAGYLWYYGELGNSLAPVGYLENKIHDKLSVRGGTLEGPVAWKDSTALPKFSSTPPFLLGIESFANGATTKWASADDVIVGTAKHYRRSLITGKLNAGATTLTISNSSITTNSVIDVYYQSTGSEKVPNYKSIEVRNGSVVITFNPQPKQITVGITVDNYV